MLFGPPRLGQQCRCVQARGQVQPGGAGGPAPADRRELVGHRGEELALLDEPCSLERTPGRVALTVSAVLEADSAVHDQAAAGLDQVQGQSQVLDDVEALAEARRNQRVRPPADGGEVEPVAPHQADRQGFAEQQPSAIRAMRAVRAVRAVDPWCEEAFRPVDQAHGGLAQLVDHLDAGLDNLRGGELLVGGDDGLDVVGQHDVVGAHDHGKLVADERERLAVVAVRAEIRLVAHVGDPRIPGGEGAEVSGDAFVRVAVIDDRQGPVRTRLRKDAFDRLLHHGDVTVVGEENVDSHVRSSFAGRENGHRGRWLDADYTRRSAGEPGRIAREPIRSASGSNGCSPLDVPGPEPDQETFVDIQNHFYGHTAALAAYAGLSRPRHVAGLIQHGWTTVPPIPVNFGDFPDVEKSGRRHLFVWSHGSRAWDPARSPRQSFALGSPWAYLVSTDAAQRQVASSSDGDAIGTLIMPLHSTRIVEVRGDQGSLAQEYLRDEGPSTVCLHAEDIHKPDIVSSWLDAGHRVVTAGPRHDPDFLSRIMALVLASERVVANRLMTPVLYAASLGRDVAVYGDVATQRRGIQDRRHQPVGHN